MEVGVRAGTSALLDVSSAVGRIVKDLDDADAPGAGKTTTVSILTTLTRVDAGTARILGTNVRAAAPKSRALTYSGGLRRRLDLAMTLVAAPKAIWNPAGADTAVRPSTSCPSRSCR